MALRVVTVLVLLVIWTSVVHAESLPCVREPALDSAALIIAKEAKPLRSDALIQAVRDADSDLVHLRSKMIEGAASTDAMLRTWMLSEKKGMDGDLVCGLGTFQNRTTAILAPRAGKLTVRWRGDKQLLFVAGELLSGFRDPSIVVEDMGHHIEKYAIDAASLRAGRAISCESIPMRVQLIATGPHGVRPVAERVVMRGATIAPVSEKIWSTLADLEHAHAEHRQQRSLSILRHNQLIAKSATSHAQRVCSTGIVGHSIDAGEGPEQRLRKAGLTARAVGEVIARADTLPKAWARLLESPSHRMVLEDSRLTDDGWGLANGADKSVCVVGLFAAWPRPTVSVHE